MQITNTKMMVWHETTPRIALKIFRSGVFYGNKMDSENGVNAYPLGPAESQYLQRQAHQKGAKMIFEWEGPYVAVQPERLDTLYNGTLHDIKPHRLFICHGQEGKLKLCDIQLTSEGKWEDTIDAPDFPGLTINTQNWQDYFASKRADWISSEISKITAMVSELKGNPKLIQVIDARTMPDHPY